MKILGDKTMSGDVDTKHSQNFEQGSDADEQTKAAPLSKDQKQLIFDYSIGLTSQDQTAQIQELIASNEDAAEIYHRLEALKALFKGIKPEPCPDELAERVIERAAELRRAEQQLNQAMAPHDDTNKGLAAKTDEGRVTQSLTKGGSVNDQMLDWPTIQRLWPNLKRADAVEKSQSENQRTRRPKRRHAVRPLISYAFSRLYRKVAVMGAAAVIFVISLGFFGIIDDADTLSGRPLHLSVSPSAVRIPGLVTGILFTDDKPCAIVGHHLVHEGDSLGDVKVLKIHRDRIDFQKAQTIWTQHTNEKPSPNWQTETPAPNPADI
ncbi:MAG: hypothetical protein ACYS8Z_04335 [Planctomycetota bacterium]